MDRDELITTSLYEKSNQGFIEPTETVRVFTDLEKSILKKAGSLNITVLENHVSLTHYYISSNVNKYEFEILNESFYNIKFSDCELILTVDTSFGGCIHIVEGIITITKIDSIIKEIIDKEYINKEPSALSDGE